MSDGVIPCEPKSDLNLSERTEEATSHPPPAPARPGPNPLSQDGPVGDIGKSKQTPRKNQSTRQNGSPHMPKLSSTPQANHRTNSFTHGIKSTTPSQAYAGPTFHASPAASSLPIPRFFSKSVPEVKKEITETSSDQSEGSPTPAFARQNVEELVREESPLDIFFKADKEQKERQRKLKETRVGTGNSISAAGGFDQPRHHSRHTTNGSMGALFPTELENREPAPTFHEKACSDPTAGTRDANNSGSPPTIYGLETPQQLEQRRAKTIALKKLLLSSVPPKSGTIPSVEQAEASEPDPPTFQGLKRASASQIHKQIAAQTTQQLSPRPRPSSNLRKEMSASALPDGGQMSELPATPTPSRTRNAYKSVPLEGRMGSLLDATFFTSESQFREQSLSSQALIGMERHVSDLSQALPSKVCPPEAASTSSAAPSSSKRSTPIPEAGGHASPYKIMEDDLRRILKLDVLPSNVATDVRS
ncbi:MAG: hypothetical protein Q9196_003986 [Gyalolechia fulgens]